MRPGNIFKIYLVAGQGIKIEQNGKIRWNTLQDFRKPCEGAVLWSHGKATLPGIIMLVISNTRRNAGAQAAMEMSYPRKQQSIFPEWIPRVKPGSGIPFPPKPCSLLFHNSEDRPGKAEHFQLCWSDEISQTHSPRADPEVHTAWRHGEAFWE